MVSGSRSLSADAPLRIAIEARIPPGHWGGVEQVAQGLAVGLGALDGPEEYLFLVSEGASSALRPFVSGSCRVLEVPPGSSRTRLRRTYDSVNHRLPALARVARTIGAPLLRDRIPIPDSDGFLESTGASLVHFAVPQAYRTGIPSLYQPYDLLHRHPESGLHPLQMRYRDVTYRAFSERAAYTVVNTAWGRDELVRAFGIPSRRVAVVPLAPLTGVVAGDSTPAPLPPLPDRFLLYPAQTWPHKNHLRLVEALAALLARGIVVPVVLTGRETDHARAIRAAASRLGVEGQLTFLGFVPSSWLGALYRRATALVFPSRFEGWGLPVVEAFALGLPVACSDSTVLPEVASGAALLFDPEDPNSIAMAIERIWTDAELREDLRSRGEDRARTMSWDRTARTFRALYRQVLGQDLGEEDSRLLQPPTLVA